MAPTRPPSPLEARLRSVLADEPALEAAWLFGSRARGEGTPKSDVDLALLTTAPLSATHERALYARLVETVRPLPLDLVLLDRAGPLLVHEATGGRRLFERSAEAADAYERRAAMRRFDTAYLRRVQAQLAREALEEARRGAPT